MSKATNTVGGVTTALIVIALAGPLGWAANTHSIKQTERGVVTHTNGSVTEMPPGGWNFLNPFTTDLHTCDVSSHSYNTHTVGTAENQQVVKNDITVLFSVDPTAVMEVFKTTGCDVQGIIQKVVEPRIQDAVKSAVNYQRVENLRGAVQEGVKQDIRTRITEALAQRHVLAKISDVSITDFDFSDQQNLAIEQAAIQEREIQTERAKLEKAKLVANQTIVAAEAQAKSVSIVSDQLSKNPAYVNYIFAKAFEARWNGQLPPNFGGGATPVIGMGSLSGGSGAGTFLSIIQQLSGAPGSSSH